MAKVFKVIMDIVVILVIVVLVALFVPPILGVTTVVSQPGTPSNMSVGTVAYGKRVAISELSAGDKIISNTEDATMLLDIREIDVETGELEVIAPPSTEPEVITLRRTASKLVFTVPVIGYILIAMNSTEGLIILGLAAALIVILFIIAEILCKKAKANEGEEEDEEDEAAQDRKYFRDLAASKGNPNKLDELGTITIPPVADLMEEESAKAQTGASPLDEEIENPELILEPVENSENPEISQTSEEEPADQEPEASFDEAPAGEDVTEDIDAAESVEETPVVPAAAAAAAVTAAAVSAAYAEEPAPEDTSPAATSKLSPVEDVPAASGKASLTDTASYSGIGSALESALEHEQMNGTPRQTTPAQTSPAAEAAPDKAPEEIELAIPARSLEELIKEAYANGEDPKVTKDSATGITFVDYSRCF